MNLIPVPAKRQDDYNSNYGDGPYPFEDYELEKLRNLNVETAWYWYSTGSYEGCGNLVARLTDGTWALKDLGHCSCYGPLDAAFSAVAPTLEELRKVPFHDEYEELFAAAEGST